MNACISPGPSRWSSFRWPSTIVASARTRRPTSPERPAVPEADDPVEQVRAAEEEAARDRAAPTRTSPESGRAHDALTTCGADRRRHRGEDLVHVADHGVVRAREDRRLAVGVDREDPLRSLAARHVLRRPGDPTRDVEVGCDLRPGLADLVGVRAPAGHGDRPEHPTAPPSREASSSTGAKPSAEPAPRPPETTTLASASEMPPVAAPTRSTTRLRERRSRERTGVNALERRRSPPRSLDRNRVWLRR